MVQILYFTASPLLPRGIRMDRSTGQMEKLAAEVAVAAGPHADRHDIDGTFVTEGVTAARDLGYLAAPVPGPLGGGDALTAEVAAAQRVVARACGSTALASAMHLHVALAAAWRGRGGGTGGGPVFRQGGHDPPGVASTGRP